jgi:hypothetical protein
VAFFKKKEKNPEKSREGRAYPAWLVTATWAIAGLMIGLMGFSLFQYFSGRPLFAFINMPNQMTDSTVDSSLPDFARGMK